MERGLERGLKRGLEGGLEGGLERGLEGGMEGGMEAEVKGSYGFTHKTTKTRGDLTDSGLVGRGRERGENKKETFVGKIFKGDRVEGGRMDGHGDFSFSLSLSPTLSPSLSFSPTLQKLRI